MHAPSGGSGRADGAIVARALGFGDDQLLLEGHQREAEGRAREGGRDVRWDRDEADAPGRSGDDPVIKSDSGDKGANTQSRVRTAEQLRTKS